MAIPDLGALHRLLALVVARKPERLTPQEVFRAECHPHLDDG